jgi:hypothetical protein
MVTRSQHDLVHPAYFQFLLLNLLYQCCCFFEQCPFFTLASLSYFDVMALILCYISLSLAFSYFFMSYFCIHQFLTFFLPSASQLSFVYQFWLPVFSAIFVIQITPPASLPSRQCFTILPPFFFTHDIS